MSRPPKLENPRQTILEAARGLVARHGHQGLSLRQVAAKVGLSPATLYGYFEHKEALMNALAQEASARFGAALGRAAARTRTGEDALVELGLAYVQFARQHPPDFLLLFTHLPSRRSGLHQAVPSGSAYGLLLEATCRTFNTPSQEVSPQVAEGVAYALWAAAHGMAMLQLTHLQDFAADFAAADRHALRALVHGLKHAP